MRIGVVGGGSIGLLTAGYLSQHFPITLYVRRKEQKIQLEQEGLLIEGGPEVADLQIRLSDEEWKEDLIILAVKQPDLPELLKTHSYPTSPDQALLFLQNGASHLDHLDTVNHANLFIGLVEHGAWKKSDTVVVQSGFGQIKIGVLRGNEQKIRPLFSDLSFPFVIVSDWEKALNEKLLINAVVNPLTALLQIPNGFLYKDPRFQLLMKNVFNDVFPILQLENEDAAWLHLLHVCQNTAENRSSMLQDIESGRRTEIDAILGVVLKRAEMRHREVPLLHFLYDSIKRIEEKASMLNKETH